MPDYHKELLSEILQEWSIAKVEGYILQLEQKRIEMEDWIKHVKSIRKKKVRKAPMDTGVRGG